MEQIIKYIFIDSNRIIQAPPDYPDALELKEDTKPEYDEQTQQLAEWYELDENENIILKHYEIL